MTSIALRAKIEGVSHPKEDDFRSCSNGIRFPVSSRTLPLPIDRTPMAETMALVQLMSSALAPGVVQRPRRGSQLQPCMQTVIKSVLDR